MSPTRKRTGLWEMSIVAREEAVRIRRVQAALVRTGERVAVHPGQIGKADAFDDIADLILTIIPVKKDVAKILTPIAAARINAAMPPAANDAGKAADDHEPTEE